SVIHQIVPIGNQVIDGTSRLAKGDATVHATRTLSPKILFRKILINLEPVIDALSNWTSRGKFARVLHESGVLTHVAPARPEPQPSAPDSGYTADAFGSLRALACARGGRL